MLFLIVGFIAGCSLIGSYVSTAKGRQAIEGAMLGGFLGPIGVLVAALMPTQEPSPTPMSRAERTWFESLPASSRGKTESRGLRI